MKRFLATLGLLATLSLPSLAVQPDEMLADPGLEARARHISTGLRCLVCQNQSIDDSEAPIARDLRLLIRDQLKQQKSDAEVVQFIVDRYGEFVLLKPRFEANTVLLWLMPFAILLAGFAFAWKRKRAPLNQPQLSDVEKSELRHILEQTSRD
ncbi:MAG: cytochrome c-type biogenesis protein [Aestuariivirga sp.]